MTANLARGRRILGVGEAMVEFAPVGDALYRRGFAGDTLNSGWRMAQLLGPHANLGYCSRVGTDAF
jgi:2-dehydro-3-deoxygluconokinase